MLRRRRLDHILGTCLRRRRVETNRDVVLKLGQKIRADIGDPEIVNLTSLNAPATGMTFEAPCIRRGGRSMTTVSPGRSAYSALRPESSPCGWSLRRNEDPIFRRLSVTGQRRDASASTGRSLTAS